MTTITTAEILAEIKAASQRLDAQDGYISIREMKEQTGLAEGRIRQALMAAKSDKRLDVRKVMRETLSGVLQPVPVYRIVPAKRKK